VNAQPRDDGDQLADLQKQERTLSTRRTQLHNRIEFLRGGGGGEDASLIEDLERQEQELSRQRSELHQRIERASEQLASGRG